VREKYCCGWLIPAESASRTRQISKLEEELGKAKARELAEARQALAYERQLGMQVIKAEGGKGAGAGKRRRGAQ